MLMIFGSINCTAQLSLSVQKQTIRQIIPQIEKISGYSFFYVNELPGLNTVKTFKADKLPLTELLSLLFRGTNITYQIKEDKQVILLPARQENTNTLPADSKRRINGKVVDETGAPLAGVNIMVKNTNIGTVSNQAGEFRIDAANASVLSFTYLGYTPKLVNTGTKTELNVIMNESPKALEELVVIGYGKVARKDLTGSVVSVQGENVSSRKTTHLSTALQGTFSGVMVTRDNNAPGAPASSVRIRGITTIGNSDPLVIIDGIPGSMGLVNASEVDNVTVLKDAASSAIYGARSAAGVILITTRRGAGSGTTLQYACEAGLEVPTKQPESVGVTRYLEMSNELRYNDNPAGGRYQAYTEDQIHNWLNYNANDPNHYPVTDWRGLILKKSALRQTHSLQLNSGSKAIKTMASFTYDNIDGLYADRNYKRYMFRLNNDWTVNDKMTVKLDMNINRSNNHQPIFDPLGSMRQIPSIYAAVWDDGRIAEGKSGGNPYGLMREGGSSDRWYTLLRGKSSIEYSPIKNLSISLAFAPLFSYTKIKSFQKKATYTLADNPDVVGGYLENNSVPFSTTKLSEERDDSYSMTSQFISTYNNRFGKNNINIMIGAENYYESVEYLTASRDGYTLTEYPYLDTGPQTLRDNGGSRYEYAYQSWFGRMMYSFDNKYLVQANVRYDGSSRFDSKHRWGIFPAFSAGWVVSNESFVSEHLPNWISGIKLRTSWGAIGNERIGNYPYLASIVFGNALFYNNGEIVSEKTAAQKQYAVSDISWEKTESTNFGTDLNLFRNRLHLSTDYYVKDTKDMLLSLKIPYFLGMADPQVNAGRMSTKGYDVDISWSDHIRSWKYNISFNFSDFISRMGDLHGTKFLGDKVKFEGSEFNEWYGYRSNGLFLTEEDLMKSPKINNNTKVGDIKYKDISGPNGVPDGIISPEYDRVLLGGSLPRYLFGGTLSISYKTLDLSVVFQGVGKQNVRLERDMTEPLRGDYGNIPSLIDGKYWSSDNTYWQNTQARYPRLTRVNVESNMAMSDYWLFNGRYLRLKNLSLGYTVSKPAITRLGIDKVRLYGTISDLFCISNYPTGWDPEMGTTSYPITTSFIIGFSITFNANSNEKKL